MPSREYKLKNAHREAQDWQARGGDINRKALLNSNSAPLREIVFDEEKRSNDESIFGSIGKGLLETTLTRDKYKKIDPVKWTIENRMIMGFYFNFSYSPNKKLVASAPRTYLKAIYRDPTLVKIIKKCRQCLTKRNYVWTDKGFYSIPQLLKMNELPSVYTLENGTIVKDKIIRAWESGEKECLDIFLRNGFRIECSKDHKIMTKNGWKRADELKFNDELIIVPKNLKFKRKTINEKLCALLGYLILVNCYFKNAKEQFTYFSKRAKKEFGRQWRPNQIKRITDIGIQKVYDIEVANKERHSFFANRILVSNSECSELEMNMNLFYDIEIPFFKTIHLFPTAGHCIKFGKERLNLAIEQSPNILRHLSQPDSLTEKRFKSSFYSLMSAGSDFGGRGPASDKITFDEYQVFPTEIEDIFAESLSHSEFGFKSYISTPGAPGTGIDRVYEQSDKKIWLVKCQKCGKWQTFKFPDNIINFFSKPSDNPGHYDKVFVGCSKCHRPLKRTTVEYVRDSHWERQEPLRKGAISGYQMSYFMLPWKSGREMLWKFHHFKFIFQFYNEVLGETYQSTDETPSRKSYEDSIDLGYNNIECPLDVKQSAMGLDWGDKETWCTILDKQGQSIRMLHTERLDGDEDQQHSQVETLQKRYKVGMTLEDAGPTADRVKTLMKRNNRAAIYGARYLTESERNLRNTPNKTVITVDEKQKIVSIPRTAYFRLMFKDIIKGVYFLPAKDMNVSMWIDHHLNLVVEKRIDPETGNVLIYITEKGPAHLGHSHIYARAALELLGSGEIQIGFINAKESRPEEKPEDQLPVDAEFIQDVMGPQISMDNYIEELL